MALGGDDGYGTQWGGERFFGISFDEGFEEGGLSYAGWADDGYEAGRGFFGDAVDLGDVVTLFFDLGGQLARMELLGKVIYTSCDRAAVFASRPGFAKPKALGLRSG